MHVAVPVYVDADVAVSVHAHEDHQALLTGPDTCMANLLVHVCVPVLFDSSKALTCTGTLHETWRPSGACFENLSVHVAVGVYVDADVALTCTGTVTLHAPQRP